LKEVEKAESGLAKVSGGVVRPSPGCFATTLSLSPCPHGQAGEGWKKANHVCASVLGSPLPSSRASGERPRERGWG